MSEIVAADFGDLIGERMRAEHRAIAGRWLHRLLELLPVAAIDVFPTDTLLDHVPVLVKEIAAYLRAPDNEAIAANAAVISKAQELGRLRHSQRASVHQVVQEYRLLGEILGAFVSEETDRLAFRPAPAECFNLVRRLNECVGVLLQTTVDTFIGAYTETIDQQTARLEGFNRMVSHELRQPLGTLQYAIALLRAEPAPEPRGSRERLWLLLDRNVARISELTLKLEALSRLRATDDNAQRQRVSVASLAKEVQHQLREMADARNVEIRIAEELPTVTTDTGRLELVLMNLISNAIKYSDPAKSARIVDVVEGEKSRDGGCVVVVRDNGLGIPAEHLQLIFGQFFRAHEHRDGELGTEGLGLGLAIVADCLDTLGGRITVESAVGEGTAFTVVLPCEPPPAPSA